MTIQQDIDTVRGAIDEGRDEQGYPAHEALHRLANLLDHAEKAMERISEQQPATLKMIRDNGFVFDDIGREPGNWKHLAFSIYTYLCEADTLARNALARLRGTS